MLHLPSPKTIILVTGGPGTGKSYAAAALMNRISSLSLLSYDRIKEQEWDRFGFDNAAQKDRVNAFALEEFYLTVQKQMWEGRSILTEYPFYQRHKEKLRELIEAYDYHAVTLLLTADWRVVYERGQRRDEDQSVRRHPGHLTLSYHKELGMRAEDIIPDARLSYEQFRADIDRKNYDIDLGTTIRVDVTDFSQVDFDEIAKRIASA